MLASFQAAQARREKSTAQEGLLAQTMYEGNEQACWQET
jgi:hypothetical protein